MATAGAGGTLPPNFFLTPQQQSLLFAALNSNKPQQQQPPQQPPQPSSTTGLTLSPSSFQASPMEASEKEPSFHETPLFDSLDYNDVGDSSFDFSFANDGADMIGDIPQGSKSDSSEGDGDGKRSHPDDEDEDDDDDRLSPKRRESSDKVPKKPGRKPLTSEPSSKRKAQNRAAQRAFRERKERHLKDLETKVEELAKVSKAANHENAKLKLQVERMTSELNHYKTKLSSMGNTKATIPKEKVTFGHAAVSNLNDVNFQFNFPKFGTLPGPIAESNGQHRNTQRSGSQNFSPQSYNQGASPTKNSDTRSPSVAQSLNGEGQSSEDVNKFNSMFTPSMASSTTNGSRVSVDSASQNFSLGNATSSPSSSSNSNMGPSSSCGTSPEPFTQSPLASKPVETMMTIGEEHSQSLSSDQPFSQFANIDFSNTNFDWLAGQNNQFDPQLFGDWREPQESVLANPAFDDFFNDAVDTDFTFPYNTAPAVSAAAAAAAAAPKTNLIDQIDAQRNDVDNIPPPAEKKNMNCNQIWDKLQSCPKAQNGDFDLDGLCSELTKKAKCSGTGPVVAEHEFDTILKKYMGKDVSTDCVATTLGIAIDKGRQNNGVGLT